MKVLYSWEFTRFAVKIKFWNSTKYQSVFNLHIVIAVNSSVSTTCYSAKGTPKRYSISTEELSRVFMILRNNFSSYSVSTAYYSYLVSTASAYQISTKSPRRLLTTNVNQSYANLTTST